MSRAYTSSIGLDCKKDSLWKWLPEQSTKSVALEKIAWSRYSLLCDQPKNIPAWVAKGRII